MLRKALRWVTGFLAPESPEHRWRVAAQRRLELGAANPRRRLSELHDERFRMWLIRGGNNVGRYS